MRSSKALVAQRAEVAAAAERRVHALREATPSHYSYMAHDADHTLRQAFRCQIDRDIIAANKRGDAIQCLKVVLLLAQNILKDPKDLTKHRFKPTNSLIQKWIVLPPGVLELVVELGFRERVEDFQPYYVFHGQDYKNLRIGSAIIEEVLERETKKETEDRRRAERVKAEEDAAKQNVYNRFIDDRRSVAARAQREKYSGQYEKGLPARRGGGPAQGNIATLHGSGRPCD